MTEPSFRLPPVAIGGVGGSGTRLVARILAETGCYLGGTLNPALDNLWFSALLRRHAWFRHFPARADIDSALQLFCKAMATGLPGAPEDADQAVLDGVGRELAAVDEPYARTLEQALHALAGTEGADPARHLRWGWKEPNTHIFLPNIAEAVPDLRYVHVIRNGLDMAFSENQQQLKNWGAFVLGPESDDPDTPLPVRSLAYWIASNRRAIRLARAAFGANFFLLNYDRLCMAPEETLPGYLEFLGVHKTADRFAALIAPSSRSRRETEDLAIFSGDQIQEVEALMALA